jgi:hypothetical protein
MWCVGPPRFVLYSCTYFNYGAFVVVCQKTGRAAAYQGDAQKKE